MPSTCAQAMARTEGDVVYCPLEGGSGDAAQGLPDPGPELAQTAGRLGEDSSFYLAS